MISRRVTFLAGLSLAAVAPAAHAATTPSGFASAGPMTGGATYGVAATTTHPTVVGRRARLRGKIAYAPTAAPLSVKKAIWAANRLRRKPYIYGGGHGSFRSSGYDCSGTVSYALHGGGLLKTPLDSSSFMGWEESGRGRWVTVYSNPGHAYAIIAGLRLDTSGAGQSGPRWRREPRSSAGYVARHPLGY